MKKKTNRRKKSETVNSIVPRFKLLKNKECVKCHNVTDILYHERYDRLRNKVVFKVALCKDCIEQFRVSTEKDSKKETSYLIPVLDDMLDYFEGERL